MFQCHVCGNTSAAVNGIQDVLQAVDERVEKLRQAA